MQAHPLRLFPGDDLRAALEDVLHQVKLQAAFVIQGIGSLSVAQLRFAGDEDPTELRDDLEILTLAGSLSPDGAHLHMSVADPRGRVMWLAVARSVQPRRYCWRCFPNIASPGSRTQAQGSWSW
jgi:predicted DNA-binding protein with PD1-like motif